MPASGPSGRPGDWGTATHEGRCGLGEPCATAPTGRRPPTWPPLPARPRAPARPASPSRQAPAHARAPSAPGPNRYPPARPPAAHRRQVRQPVPHPRGPGAARRRSGLPGAASGRPQALGGPAAASASRSPSSPPALPRQPRRRALRTPGPRRAQAHADGGSLPAGMPRPEGRGPPGRGGALAGWAGTIGEGRGRPERGKRRGLLGRDRDRTWWGKGRNPTEIGGAGPVEEKAGQATEGRGPAELRSGGLLVRSVIFTFYPS